MCLILKALELSWGSFFDGPRAFQFQICGRLLNLRCSDVISDTVIKSFEAHTTQTIFGPLLSRSAQCTDNGDSRGALVLLRGVLSMWSLCDGCRGT